jgi:hypothetical protein
MDPISIVAGVSLLFPNAVMSELDSQHHRIQPACNARQVIEQLGEPSQFQDFQSEGYDRADNKLCSAKPSSTDARVRYRIEWDRARQSLIVTKLDW